MAEILRYTLSNPHRLPSPYIPLSFLQSTGTQWIDTKWKPNLNTKTYILFAMTEYVSYLHIFYACNSSGSNRYGFMSTSTDGAFRYDWAGNMQDSSSTQKMKIGDVHHVIYGKDMIVDGTTIVSNRTTSIALEQNMYLFAANYNNSAGYLTKMKLYSCKIWDGDSLVRDFVPCMRTSDSLCGLFDLVTQTFYSNSGTGSFLAGPPLRAIPSEYQLVEYLTFPAGKSYSTGISVPTDHTLVTLLGIRYAAGGSGRDLWGYSGAGNGYDGVTNAGAWESHGGSFSQSDITKYTEYSRTDTLSSEYGTYILGSLGYRYSVRTKYISYLKLTLGGTLQADYVACYRKSDMMQGFYDFVSGSFKAVGSSVGEYPLGPSLPSSGGLVEWNGKGSNYPGLPHNLHSSPLNPGNDDSSPAIGRNEGGTDFSAAGAMLKAAPLTAAQVKSVSFWINCPSVTRDRVVWVDSGSQTGYGINGGYQIIVTCAGNSKITFPTTALKANTWLHIVIVYDTTPRLYIDGVKITPRSDSNSWTHNKSEFIIGCRYAGAYASHFGGCMYDFRVFDTLIDRNGSNEDLSQIQSIYLAK